MRFPIWPKPDRDGLDRVVSKVADYMTQQRSTLEFRPQVIAKAINESYLSVLAALYVLEEKKVVGHWYGVFCGRTNASLGRFRDLAEAEAEIYCRHCDEDHNPKEDSAYIDLFFTARTEKLQKYSTVAA
jgi:hypothetical protein